MVFIIGGILIWGGGRDPGPLPPWLRLRYRGAESA